MSCLEGSMSYQLTTRVCISRRFSNTCNTKFITESTVYKEITGADGQTHITHGGFRAIYHTHLQIKYQICLQSSQTRLYFVPEQDWCWALRCLASGTASVLTANDHCIGHKWKEDSSKKCIRKRALVWLTGYQSRFSQLFSYFRVKNILVRK